MSVWLAKAKKNYRCDNCGKIIRKGEEKYVEGYKCLAYTIKDDEFRSILPQIR